MLAAKSRTVAAIRDRSPTIRRISRTERNLPAFGRPAIRCARAGAGRRHRLAYLQHVEPPGRRLQVWRADERVGPRRSNGPNGTRIPRITRRPNGTRITRGSRGRPIGTRITADHEAANRRDRGSRPIGTQIPRDPRRSRDASADLRDPRPVCDPRDPRPSIRSTAIRETVPRFVNTSVRRCSVRNRLAISIQPVGQSNSTGTRKCAVQPLARMRLGPVDSWHRLLRRLVETFEKRLVSNRASGKTRHSRANLSLQVQELLTFAARQYWRRRPAAFAASHRWCNSRILG